VSADVFDKLVHAFLGDPAITTGRMFGSDGLKVNGKVFAMNVKGDLVVKLPAGRCAALLENGRAHPFDPGHGRLMKEWVAVPPERARDWRRLADEARTFVGGG